MMKFAILFLSCYAPSSQGQSRSQPVGDGIVDGPVTRQVRFASVDRTWQRSLSGSDFGSDFSRDFHSSDQVSYNVF